MRHCTVLILWLALGWVSARSVDAWTQEAYVWQRQPSAALKAALRETGGKTDGVHCLAAEVSWVNGRFTVVQPRLDDETLRQLPTRVGLVLRIGAFAGSFDAEDTTRRLVALATEILNRARDAGVTVAELQVDYDCAESKLFGYTSWLKALRAACGETPLVFTALPAWLKTPAFGELARAADGFVLQVHSLERPTGPNAPFLLCDPVRAMTWARQAAEVGVAYRVALPTYGYVLAFDANGTFLGLSADGGRREWPPGTIQRVVRADAAEMARLALALEAEQLRHCKGVIWFRLPVAGERLNWEPSTFGRVLEGMIPATSLEVVVRWENAGLAEIAIANRGDTSEPLPSRVGVQWPANSRVLAGDGLRGFRLEARGEGGQGILRAIDILPDAVIAPGREVVIGWLRFAHELSLQAHLPSSAAEP